MQQLSGHGASFVDDAAVDGKSGVEMSTAIHTQTPALEIPEPPATRKPERGPTSADLLVSFAEDREMMPDPVHYAEGIEASFQSLVEAT